MYLYTHEVLLHIWLCIVNMLSTVFWVHMEAHSSRSNMYPSLKNSRTSTARNIPKSSLGFRARDAEPLEIDRQGYLRLVT